MKPAVPARRTPIRVFSLLAVVLGLLWSPAAFAAGFEVGENTTKSVARGGTGVASKDDPSALYFNPALVSSIGGTQVMVNSSFLKLNLEFQRDPLTEGGETTEFAPVTNDQGFHPAPMAAMSYEIIPDEFALAVAFVPPSAYGRRCFGERVDGECEYEETNSARHMMLAANIIEMYGTLGASYKLKTKYGNFSFGSAFILAYQRFDFDIVVNADVSPGNVTEDPDDESLFTARGLEDWKPSGIFGLAYQFRDFTFGASYRLPFKWAPSGEVDFTVPPNLQRFGDVGLSNDEITLETNQAGALRVGIGYEHYVEDPERPVFDVAFDFLWENWSAVERYVVRPEGQLEANSNPLPFELHDVYQAKNFEDTMAFRLGGGYYATDWLTIHAGGFYETAAQPEEYTSPDWVSWERVSVGGGVTVSATDWLDVDLAYSHVFSPDRTVENGEIYNAIVFSECTGPDYDDPDNCDEPGTPPGNPQNNGEWSSSFDFASIGVTMHWD
ncbi:MAG: OmpP1/FadL family transporter [Myxococcota bacterium]